MKHERPPELHSDLVSDLERHALRCQADLHKLDSEFQTRFATADAAGQLQLLEDYCVRRFNLLAEWTFPVAAAKNAGPARLSLYERLLLDARNAALHWLDTILGLDSVLGWGPADVRDECRSRVALLIEGHRNRWRGKVKETHLERLPPSPPVRHPNAAVIKRRRERVREYQRANDLSAAGLAKSVGIDQTAVRAVVREDRKRFLPAAQTRLLKVLGVSEDDWYQP